MDFRTFIKIKCAELNKSQVQLSLDLGWHERQISALMTRNHIGRKVAQQLADYFGCNIFDIPGTSFYGINKSAGNPSEVLNNVENSFTHKSFLTIKCPCCGKNVVISALCVSKIEDLEE